MFIKNVRVASGDALVSLNARSISLRILVISFTFAFDDALMWSDWFGVVGSWAGFECIGVGLACGAWLIVFSLMMSA